MWTAGRRRSETFMLRSSAAVQLTMGVEAKPIMREVPDFDCLEARVIIF